MRNEFRAAMLSYIFDYKEVVAEEEMTFDGFHKQALYLMDDLDDFTQS